MKDINLMTWFNCRIAAYSKLSAIVVVSGLALNGCADGTNVLATGSLGTPKVAAAKAVDPVCVALNDKINALRSEGTMARLAKVSTGKSRSTMIKRVSLGKAARLDQANAEFQAKCTSFRPTAAAVRVPTPAVASKGKTAAKVLNAATKVAKQTATNAIVKAAAQNAITSAKKDPIKAATSVVTSIAKKQ